ncbi:MULTISPECIES: hypothetical protein [unclassified Polaromonas]|jgi:hypothetical protein|uniref:hypothetical protein n=1 Tax=unclassified Polaromonas TaxID=2638319 RepID=UPI000BC47943|nr:MULTISPECIES: hypothetical protein [unclassified Polaromonas]OYY38950.1 MAG: hypothetical protein B7Y60_01285 [Polaromonas sp. 35-63-35]OYZ21815.1 MAG: hypothetical protein B7Y28_02715 [Polaromonas sp. 16-63-31]OYZ80255.1 MAG: hypothetical protein B7Y09_03345 [Polaromonas sp. 24-63-21]OZA51316.1 MAG: hypothetical protein B7X88_06770 [Polaromonas sp. 17-63-33]OZA90212.1 MAG: hypothetical protein B7X65_02425 [Polaromonas sp. 39-63-25]
MFAIAPYLVEVKDEKKQPQDLWDFYNKQNLRTVLLDYYKTQLGNYQVAPNKGKKMFLVAKLFKGTPTSVTGIYQTGAFGFESDIYSTTKKTIAHNRQSDEADMMPFNFSFYMPQQTTSGQRKRGLLLLGRFNTLGVRQLTLPHLQKHFKNRFPEFSLEINRVVPSIVLETLMSQGTLKTIRLVKKILPSDLADVFSSEDKEKVSEIEMVIRTKRKSSFSDIDWLIRAVEAKTHPRDIVTIPGFNHDNIKLEIQLDGHPRIVDLGNTGKLSSNIEISSVKVHTNGHPDAKSWLGEADDLASSIVKSWGVKGMTWQSRL